MERKIAIMAIITGIAIFGGVAANVSSFMSNSNEDLSPQSANALLSGHVQIIVYDPNGEMKRYITGDNIITNNGENCIMEYITGIDISAGGQDSECKDIDDAIGNAEYDIIAIGTGGSTVAETDDALEAFVFSQKVTPSQVESTGTSTGSVGTVTWVATFTASGPQIFKESGIFDTTGFANGNILAHTLFGTAATLTSGDTVAVTWVIVVGADT